MQYSMTRCVVAVGLALAQISACALPGTREDLDPIYEPATDPAGPDGSNAEPTVTGSDPELPLVLSQTTSQTIEPAVFVACGGAEGFHAVHSFFRVYRLESAQVGQAMQVRRVDFGVERAEAPAGAQPIVVRLHGVTGDFHQGNLQLLAETTVQVPNQTLGMVQAPFDVAVPSGTSLAVEVQAVDGKVPRNRFHLGANRAPQTAPCYLRAPSCGLPAPADVATTPYPDTHVVINLLGRPTP